MTDPTHSPTNSTDAFRFMLLGGSGSGKTSFLAGLSSTLVNLSLPVFDRHFSLRATTLEGQEKSLLHAHLTEWPEFVDRDYPPSTTREYELISSLWLGAERIATLGLYDYRGGDTTSLINPDKREDVSTKLIEELERTDCILVFISAIDLLYERLVQKKDWEDITYNSYHTPLGYFDKVTKVVNVLRERRPGVGIVFLLTKVDAVADFCAAFPIELGKTKLLKADKTLNYSVLLAETEQLAQQLLGNHAGPWAIIPVSAVGLGRTQNSFSVVQTRVKQGMIQLVQMRSLIERAPKPLNLHLPLLYPLLWLLEKAKRGRNLQLLERLSRQGKPYYSDLLEQLLAAAQENPELGLYRGISIKGGK